jgi:DNA-binding NtrC family response regulator
MTVGKVLVVEDDDSLRRVTQIHLEKFGFATTTTEDAEQALRHLEQTPFDVLLTDLHLPGMSGLDLLKKVKVEYPETIVILVTAFGTVSSAVEAMKSGAHDYITKPLHHFELNELVRRAIDH